MAILDWDNFERIHGRPEGAREAFENVCYELLNRKYGKSATVQKIRTNHGDSGIDIIIGEIGKDALSIYQCKYFRDFLGDSQKAQIRRSFKTIIEQKEYQISNWILMYPNDMSIEEKRWWDYWKKEKQYDYPYISISCLCGRELLQELITYKIYDQYFSIPNTKLIGKVEKEEKSYNGIDSYITTYTDILFLQEKGEPQIKLMDLYIESEYDVILSEVEELEGWGLGLQQYIEEFVNYNGKVSQNTLPIIFIEGHAGIGKTTFVSRLAYEYKQGNIFKDKNLYIIKLRDLLPSGEKVNLVNPWKDLQRFLKPELDLENFLKEMDNSVLILEGFDELSMIDNIQNENKSKYINKIYETLALNKCNCHIIITSRPDYLVENNNWSKITACKNVLRLRHLSEKKKREWINLATQHGLYVSPTLEREILYNNNGDVSAIISTPFTLYLIVHNQSEIGDANNLWGIYFKIFGKEMVKKSYDKIAHPSELLADYIFQITYEIAFYMFCNNKLDISWSEIELVINSIIIPEKDIDSFKAIGVIKNSNFSEARIELRRLLKNNYALHTYYKRNEDGGGLAFIHNYIKDFFVAEKVITSLNTAYEKLEGSALDSKSREYLNIVYYELFSNNFLNDKVLSFLISYIKYEIGKDTSDSAWIRCESREFTKRIFPRVFSDMLINGFCFTNKIIEKLDSECIEKPINESYNLWIIYKALYMHSKFNTEYITMLINEEFKNRNKVRLFRILVNEMLSVNNKLFSGINLKNMDLGRVMFSKATLDNCNFSNSNLLSVDFSDANLLNCNFVSSNCVEANFRKSRVKNVNAWKAIFSNSDFGNAVLETVALSSSCFFESEMKNVTFSKCTIINSDFSSANMCDAIIKENVFKNTKFIKTDLSKSNCEKAVFKDCIIKYVNFRDANLQNTVFDGKSIFCSDFSGADLSRADFSDQSMRECILENCKLIGTNFSKTKMKKVQLKKTNLSSTILKKSELNDVNLDECILTNTNLAGCKMTKTSLKKADVSYANLHGTLIEKSELEHTAMNDILADGAQINNSNLSRANLIRASLVEASLEKSILCNAIITYAKMEKINLRQADLRGANLQGVDLSNADLEKANLEGADLIGANLSNANLKNANIKNTLFRGIVKYGNSRKRNVIKHTIFNNTNLEGVKINMIQGYKEEDMIHLIKMADYSKADFKGVPVYVKKLFE